MLEIKQDHYLENGKVGKEGFFKEVTFKHKGGEGMREPSGESIPSRQDSKSKGPGACFMRLNSRKAHGA